MDIRDNLAAIIKEKALIQAEVARRSDLTPIKLGAILTKKRKLEANELFRICEVISMSPEAVANYETSQTVDSGQAQ